MDISFKNSLKRVLRIKINAKLAVLTAAIKAFTIDSLEPFKVNKFSNKSLDEQWTSLVMLINVIEIRQGV